MKKFVALYVGQPNPSGASPNMSEEALQAGMKAWGDWMGVNAARIVDMGGPLGKTKSASKEGVADIRNNVGGYIIIEAQTHDEAARLFENHPHFTHFPGDAVEVMEVMPMPGG